MSIIDSTFFFRPITMTVLWIILFSLDWLLDWWGAVLYHRQVKSFCLFEKGYNLKALSAGEIRHPSRIILRFFSELLISSTAIWLLLSTCRLYSNWKFYELFCGFFVLLEACVHFRHVRNVAVFSIVKPESGLYGSIAVPRWMTLRNAFIEFATFGIAFLIIFFFDQSNFFALGGVLACTFAILYQFSISEFERRDFFNNNRPARRTETIIAAAESQLGIDTGKNGS